MGVQGLWELLAPVGRRVSVETLAGKRVAIDASIWMVQFMKAMRDEKGEMVRNAHLIGFFRRICKLLFLRTKPVFVFDGGTPALKRRTVIARRRQRENAQAKIRKTAEKLLLNHLKAVRLKELAKELENQRQQQKKNGLKGKRKSISSESTQTGIDSVDQRTHQEITDEMLTEQFAAEKDGRSDNEPLATSKEEGNETEEMILKNEAKGKKILSDDGNRAMTLNQEKLDEMLATSIAAEEGGGLTNNASTSHPTNQLENELDDEDEDEDEEMLLPVMHRDVDPNVLAALPPSMQLDLLVQMRERLMAENRQKYQKVKKAPEKFSELQIQAYLKTVAFRREIDGVQKAAGGRGVCGVQTSRIASEANREFIFSSSFTGDKQELASARGEGNEKKQQSTGTLHHKSDSIDSVMSICKSNSMIGLGPEETRTYDDDVETYLDEMGRVRVSRHRAMGIRMTRDLQRNLDLMKEIDQERTVPIKVTNIESTPKSDQNVSPKIFSSENQSDEISHEGIIEPVSMNYRLEQSMFKSGASVEISFEDNDNNNSLGDSDDIFTRLAAGVPVTISSSVNSPRKKPSCSPSDCEWEEEPVAGKCNSSLGDVKNDIQFSLHECNLSDESEVEWEETPPDSHVKDVPFPPKSGQIASQGHLQEEADLQEAIKRSLLDLGCEKSSQAFSEPDHSKRPSNFTDEEINLGGMNFPEVSGIQRNKLLSDTVDVTNKFNTAGGVNISQAFDSPDSHLNFSTIHDSEDNGLLISKKHDNHACSYSEQSLNNTTEGDSVDRETLEAVFTPQAKKATSLSEQCSNETNHDYGITIIANNYFGDNSLHSNAISVEKPDVLLVENKKFDSEAEPLVLLSSKVKNTEDESSILVDRHDIKPKLFPQLDDPSNPLAESSKKESTCDIVMDQILTVESSHENQYQAMQHNMDNFATRDTENVPVEYTEASLEDEMLILDQERIDLGDEQRRLERNAESVSSEMFAECQELLQIFGLPYIIAPMEAEAQCAYMELMNIVDGVITDDSDVFLFGARSVYKNIFDDRKYVETYFMKDIEKELGLSREKLIDIALLLGSDYTEGVSGIGIVNAIEVVNAFPEEDGLLKFREWIESPDPTILGKLSVQSGSSPRKRGSKVGNNDITGSVEEVPACNESILQANESKQTTDDIHEIKQIFMNKHRNVSKNWHIPSSFPSEAVISAYTCPQVDKSTDPFTWGKPDLMVLRKLCWEKFGWNIQKTDELLLPVLKEYEKRETQLRLEAFYTFNERFAKIRSKRIKKAVKGINGNRSSELMDDTLQVLSKSRKKGGVRSEGGDDKLEEPLLKDEDSVDMQNTAKESTSNRSSKRASRRKLVTSESVPKPPLMAGSKKDGNDDFCPGGSIYPNPKESSLFLSLGRQVDVYFPLRKRSRITAPFVFSGFEQTRAPLDVLPDECLFEILRRVPAGQERSACASVSKRWLTLLSSIKRDEFNKADKKTKDTITEKIPEVEDQDVEVDGYLARSLVGKKATDIRLAAIAIGTSSRGGLAKLSIHGSNSARRVTDLGLKAIACGCPSLRVLSLWGLSSIGDVGLSEIANGCPQLEKLDLSNCPAITDKSLLAFAKNCPLLSDVTIDSCSNIGNDGLQAVARCCPNLKSVAITNCPLVGDQGIAGMFSQATYTLKKVRLQKLNITDMSLAVVGHYGLAITNLVLSALPNVSEKGFWVMANGHGLQMLKSLTVASCLGVTDTGLEAIGRGCPNLQHLCVRHCTFLSDNGLVSFTKAAMSLESLQLEECHRITQFGLFGSLINCGAKLKAFSLVSCLAIRDLNLSFPLSSPCESMRSLSIRKCPGFGDASLAVIGKLCPKLQHIELCGLNGITDDGILPLLQSCDDGLLKINLSGCVNLTDKVVLTIGALHSWTIEMLNLDGCRNISDVSLVAIAKNCQRLSDLDISKCAITDYGIEALAFASQLNLQVLSVFGCSLISDESLESIGNLGQTLRGLNLQQCSGISSSSIDLLLEQLWRCDIVF